MPGSSRWIYPRRTSSPPWTHQPFSYVKVCRAAETVLFIAIMVALGIFVSGSEHSDLLIMGCVAAVIISVMVILEKIIWKMLPAHVKARIPYDMKEALENKGDIRQLRDLPRLWRTNESR